MLMVKITISTILLNTYCIEREQNLIQKRFVSAV